MVSYRTPVVGGGGGFFGCCFLFFFDSGHGVLQKAEITVEVKGYMDTSSDKWYSND